MKEDNSEDSINVKVSESSATDERPVDVLEQEPVHLETSSTEATKPGEHHKHAKKVLFLVFLILIAVIVGLSLLLLNEKKDEQSQVEEINETSQKTDISDESTVEEINTVISAEWGVASTDSYKIKLPDGWNAQLQDNGVLIYNCPDSDCYQLKEGQTAEITNVVGGRDGLQGLLYVLQAADTSIDVVVEGYTELDKLENNFTRYKRVILEQETSEIGTGDPEGTIEYVYVRPEKNNKFSYLRLTVLPTQSDPSYLVEEMLNTLVINAEESL